MKASRTQMGAVALLVIGSIPRLAEACVSVYADHNVDTVQEEVQAWAWVEDCEDMGGSNPPYFEHQYYASVHIESPTQNSTGDSDNVGPVAYAGGSADAYASISYDGDFGGYDIELQVEIVCSFIGGFFDGEEEDYVPAPGDCTADGITSEVVANMSGWGTLAWERGGTIDCVNDSAVATRLMDSFEEIFDGSYYTPTNDPCRINLLVSGGTYAGFHSHPLFDTNAQLNRGETCHGDGPYNLSAQERWQDFNGPNRYFQDDDLDWKTNPGLPLYLLVPDADQIKIQPTSGSVETVWQI